MSERWRDEGLQWQAAGGHWANFGQRIAFHAQALARREALRAQREAEREIDHDVDHEDDSIDQDRHDREREHGARRCEDEDYRAPLSSSVGAWAHNRYDQTAVGDRVGAMRHHPTRGPARRATRGYCFALAPQRDHPCMPPASGAGVLRGLRR